MFSVGGPTVKYRSVQGAGAVSDAKSSTAFAHDNADCVVGTGETSPFPAIQWY